MSNKPTVRVKLWRVAKGAEATQFATDSQTAPTHRKIWVPISVTEHVSVDPHPPGEWAPCTVTMEEWFAIKEDLV